MRFLSLAVIALTAITPFPLQAQGALGPWAIEKASQACLAMTVGDNGKVQFNFIHTFGGNDVYISVLSRDWVSLKNRTAGPVVSMRTIGASWPYSATQIDQDYDEKRYGFVYGPMSYDSLFRVIEKNNNPLEFFVAEEKILSLDLPLAGMALKETRNCATGGADGVRIDPFK